MKYLLALIALCCTAVSSAQQPTLRYDENGVPIIYNEEGKARDIEGNAVSEQDLAVLVADVQPLPGNIAVTYDDLRKIIDRQLQLAQSANEIASKRLDEARARRITLEEELKRAQAATEDADLLEQIGQRLATAQEIERLAKHEARLAGQEVRRLASLSEGGEIVEEYKRQRADSRQAAREFSGLDIVSAQSYESVLLDDDYQPFSHTREVIQNPQPGCHAEYDGLNPNGKFQRILEKETLFDHTDESMRPFLDGKEFMTCKAGLTQVGGYRYVSVVYHFSVANAARIYGEIRKGSALTITTLAGQYVRLPAGKTARGELNTETQEVVYEVYYAIDQGQLNLLKKDEIDRVIVSWSSGHEEYEAYHPGFFIQQIPCLLE
ncbi:hypothetical protein [Phaeodactylibacter luteus]|uniref:Uncharacterized protein n=1 Tax=Phaeodactylibacter luteus TaxID=1564516 RepID=A0A5C6RQ34_9BACT|nr:hypothetical protein [Phaeodactylibacter luteus]TXB63770.1 hypothetical protein FRY97_08090 [Phaeodactylibacter luteus]